MRFSPFDFDVVTSPEETEAVPRRARRQPIPTPEKSADDAARVDLDLPDVVVEQ